MGNVESQAGYDQGSLPQGPTFMDTALCVCPGERKDLQILGMGVNGCQSRENIELRKLDESLLLACTLGKADGSEIKALLHRGANIHAMRQPEGKTSLHLAAHAGSLDATKALCECGADVDAIDNDDRTPLHVAALNGHLEVVHYLLENAYASHSMLDKNDQTALHFACIGGYLEVCHKLIEHGAWPEVDTPANLQPLHFAALSGHTSIAKLLLQASKIHPDPTIQDPDINCLCAEDLQSPLHCAASRGHAMMVGLLITKGAEIDIRNASNATPLHHASMNNHIRVVERLLEANANPLAVAKNNWTPMLMAFRQGHMECGRLLESHATNMKRKMKGQKRANNGEGSIPQTMSECATALEGTGLIVNKTSQAKATWNVNDQES